VDALLGQTTAVWTMYTDKAALQYKRSASDVSVMPFAELQRRKEQLDVIGSGLKRVEAV
jgi:hypothetical protein